MSSAVDARGLLLVVVCVASAYAAKRPDGTIVLPVADKQDIHFVPLSAGGEVLNKWIRGIAQDNQGFMWFATDGGLYRYDGYAITPYLHDPRNSNLQTLTSYGVGWKSFTEQYLDSCGIFRDAVLSILATIAKQERIRLSERVTAGLERARKQGRVGGRPKVVTDRHKVVELREAGKSFGEIAKEMALPKSTVARIVREAAA